MIAELLLNIVPYLAWAAALGVVIRQIVRR